MKLSPRELLFFAELWRTLGARPRRAAELMEATLTRKERKRRQRKTRRAAS